MRAKIGLALGAGGFRGLAHIGVLDVLEREGVPIHRIAGCSMGAVIGALYATGMTPHQMAAQAGTLTERQIYDLGIPRKGLLAGARAQALIRELTEGKTFAETRLPFAALACDFETMEPVALTEGPLDEAVRASISIPVVFTPVEREGRVLVDGGMLDRVPASLCRRMGADIVLGVDVGYRGQRVSPAGLIGHAMHAIDIFQWQITQQRVSEADLMITPDVLDIDPLRIGGRALECVEQGRAAARAALPDIRALLERAET